MMRLIMRLMNILICMLIVKVIFVIIMRMCFYYYSEKIGFPILRAPCKLKQVKWLFHMLRKSVRSSDDSMANLLLSDSRINCASSTNASTGWNKSRNSNSSRPITSHEAAVLTQGNVFSNQSQGMHPVHLNANSKGRRSKSSTWVSMAKATH